jgi:diguanylate cyclase (GGDEF)-like protein
MDQPRINRNETDHAGDDRDRIAEGRDKSAEAHDQESEARDQEAEARDERAEIRAGGTAMVDRGAETDRAEARQDRQGGANDRTHASHDREAALLDRLDAAADREQATAEQALLSTDDLTGAYNRGPGYAELKREIARARRTGKPLTLAFVDIDGLKDRNDDEGHASGDELLRGTAAAIRSRFRPYDLIIRYGGDEFVCVLFDMDTIEAATRFSLVNTDIAATHQGSVTVGLAMLTDDDALEDLLRRADADMYGGRRSQTAGA